MPDLLNQICPVLMIGLDAADLPLIERLCVEGRLPTLQKLRRRGCFGLLAEAAPGFTGAAWPSFATSRDVGGHGLYHSKLWCHEHMHCEVPRPRGLPEPPFWASLSDLKLAIVDMPLLGVTPRAGGVQLAGWAAHDPVARNSWPRDLWRRLEREVGSPVLPPELPGSQSPRSLLQLKDMLLRAADQLAAICERLLDREPWDLFLVVFGVTRRAGLYLTDLSQLDPAGLSVAERRDLEEALAEVYQACDRAIGRLLAKHPADARVVVFAVNGMAPNSGWGEYFPAILDQIRQVDNPAPARGSLLFQLKRQLPGWLTRQVITRLPQQARAGLLPLWSAGMCDWETTRYFGLPTDSTGYLRINLRGREPLGIVAPADYQALCDRLAVALESFYDLASGEPIIERVYRRDEIVPADAAQRDRLPDLLISWRSIPATGSPGVGSPLYGELRWDAERLPSGRSGVVCGGGWFIAVGEDIQPGSRCEGASLLDLAPTVLRWFEREPPPAMQGRPIAELCSGLREVYHDLVLCGTPVRLLT